MPELVYPDVRRAMLWLVVMAADGGERENPHGDLAHGVMVRVEDVDAYYERASARGARIIDEPTDFPYGERQYNAEDLAGHRWTFSESIADVAPEDWGGHSSGQPSPIGLT